jgi:TonB family protein
VNIRTCIFVVSLLGGACAERENIGPSTPRASVSPPTTDSAALPPVIRNGMHSVSLRGVGVPFAAYLNGMHRRIHPEYTDKDLVALAKLPLDDPMSDKKLVTRVELVVSGADGTIVSATVGKSSGLRAFDSLAVDSLRRAAPFGPAPREIVSDDGNVYVDWELGRDETFACSTLHSRPYLLAR